MKYDQTPKAAHETKSRFNDEIVAIGKDLQRIFEITAILTNQYNNEQQKLPAWNMVRHRHVFDTGYKRCLWVVVLQSLTKRRDWLRGRGITSEQVGEVKGCEFAKQTGSNH